MARPAPLLKRASYIHLALIYLSKGYQFEVLGFHWSISEACWKRHPSAQIGPQYHNPRFESLTSDGQSSYVQSNLGMILKRISEGSHLINTRLCDAERNAFMFSVMHQSSSREISDVQIVDLAGLDVSIIIATFLYAISCSQVFVYWRSGFGDRWIIRWLVSPSRQLLLQNYSVLICHVPYRSSPCGVCLPLTTILTVILRRDRILETIHSVMFWIHQYHSTVPLYGNADSIKIGCWALNYSLVVHGLITAFVQVRSRPSLRL